MIPFKVGRYGRVQSIPAAAALAAVPAHAARRAGRDHRAGPVAGPSADIVPVRRAGVRGGTGEWITMDDLTQTVPGKPSVVVLALGGTIASAGSRQDGARVRLTGADLVAAVPQAAAVAGVTARSVAMLPSADLTHADLIGLRSAIGEALASGADGVVVTQGTDTLEETAYAMDLMTGHDAPVVFTGAMRNASLPGADGPANLLAAIQVAASPRARGLGVLVAFDDEIHAARFVRKRHATATSAFGSPLAGPIGYVSEDRVRILLRPPGRLHVPVPAGAAERRVAVAWAAFGDDGALIETVPSLGYDGLVVAAFGAGHLPANAVAAVESVAARVPVVLASRTGAGEVLRATYAFPGSESDLLGRGLIPACGLGPAHAAVLLRLLLMAGADRGDLAGYFEAAVHAHGPVSVRAGEPA